ncbi:STAS domain-containing protein [Streptomyces sp. 3211]|uniref:STAS domain-containing protein n=1 Tax=Streptomyces sp. 3211 TaxID=1964449 RepID=UPI0009A4CFBC|nr:STAS domain-containing protein [Streptomyces sp. 3211]
MGQQVQVPVDVDGVGVIVCAGDFDQDTLSPLRAACSAAADAPGVRRIILDVTQVAFADSAMLNLMMIMLRTGRLVLAGPVPPRLGRVLDLTQARELFPTAAGIDAARSLETWASRIRRQRFVLLQVRKPPRSDCATTPAGCHLLRGGWSWTSETSPLPIHRS